MQNSSTSGSRGRVPATEGQTRRPLVVRQTRASVARAAAARGQQHSIDTTSGGLSRRAAEPAPWHLSAQVNESSSQRPEDGQNLVSSSSRANLLGSRTTSLTAPKQQQQRLSEHSTRDAVGAVKARKTPLSGPAAGAMGVRRSETRPDTTVRCLQTNPRTTDTAKGRLIQQDLADLADDYYSDGVYSQPPVTGGASFPGREPRDDARQTHHNGEDEEGDETETVPVEKTVRRSWMRGPTDTEGRLFDSSDLNLLCMDVLLSSSPAGRSGGTNVAVVGSADHGLRVFDLDSCQQRKHLYTKTCGHTEWVTACRFLSDGRVLSGGMDSKLCLWDSVLRGGPARCQDLLAHTGSISQIDVDCTHSTAVSASYDRTLRIWHLGGGVGRDMGCLSGHKAPVTHFDWRGATILSGDRQGTAKIWDVSTATNLLTCSTKRGQIGALGSYAAGGGHTLSLLGDQGGVLTVLDARQGKKPVHQSELHPGGVISGIQDTARYIVTCGADKRICVLDPRAGFTPLHVWTEHRDFIYSLKTFGPLVLSGAGNGWLLVHDTDSGECLYGLGANKAAVREMHPTDHYLVAAGDDGKAVVYDYA